MERTPHELSSVSHCSFVARRGRPRGPRADEHNNRSPAVLESELCVHRNCHGKTPRAHRFLYTSIDSEARADRSGCALPLFRSTMALRPRGTTEEDDGGGGIAGIGGGGSIGGGRGGGSGGNSRSAPSVDAERKHEALDIRGAQAMPQWTCLHKGRAGKYARLTLLRLIVNAIVVSGLLAAVMDTHDAHARPPTPHTLRARAYTLRPHRQNRTHCAQPRTSHRSTERTPRSDADFFQCLSNHVLHGGGAPDRTRHGFVAEADF